MSVAARRLGRCKPRPSSAPLRWTARPRRPHKAVPAAGAVKDLAQVRAAGEHFAALDDAGKPAAAFGPARGTADDVLAAVASVEGWILGV